MIKCVAIDDEPLALDIIDKYIQKIPELVLLAKFTDGIEAKQYLLTNTVDVLFLDIEMPDINGLQLIKSLSQIPLVVFTTAYKEYAVDGFELKAIDYLLKPFSFSRFQDAVYKINEKLIAIKSSQEIESILRIYVDYKLVSIGTKSILYMEAMNDYIKIHTFTAQYLTLMSMKAMLEKLPKNQFLRIHRSFIVSKNYIEFVQFKKLGLSNGIELPIGSSFQKEIKNQI